MVVEFLAVIVIIVVLTLVFFYKDAVPPGDSGIVQSNIYETLAKQGNPSAQYELGMMYRNGDGVPKDMKTAFEWMEKSAVQGNVHAQIFLGMSYEEGNDCPQNYEHAVEWYVKAASPISDNSSQSDHVYISNARRRLGFIYAKGHGLPKYGEQVVRWLSESVDVPSALYLGTMFAYGSGVKKNDELAARAYITLIASEKRNAKEAPGLVLEYADEKELPLNFVQVFEWLKATAEHGLAEAEFAVGWVYVGGWRVIPEDRKEGVLWLRKAATHGNTNAQSMLEKLDVQIDSNEIVVGARDLSDIEFNEGVASFNCSEFTAAEALFLRAAERGHGLSQFHLANMYMDGRGIPQDYSRALYWLERAADQGHVLAQFNLGNKFTEGKAVAQDRPRAVYWFQKAADQGLAEAQHNLGFIYDEGIGGAKDHQQAVVWYQKAAEQGYAPAQHNLGDMYYKGRGVVEHHGNAMFWFQKAAEQGIESSQSALGLMYMEGHGSAQDIIEGYKWFHIAWANGENVKANLDLAETQMMREHIDEALIRATEWLTSHKRVRP